MIAADNPDSHRHASEGRVLIFAPTRNDGASAQTVLREAGLDAVAYPSVAALCYAASIGCGVIVVAEEALTPPALDAIVELVAGQPPWSEIPIIILTHPAIGDSYLRGGAPLDRLESALCLERPLKIVTLVRTVQASLVARRRQYQIRDYLQERNQVALEREREVSNQQAFIRGVLSSVTEGKLVFCASPADLPPSGPDFGGGISLTRDTLHMLRSAVISGAQDTGLGPDRVHDLVTAAGEVAMNAIVHAGGGWGCVDVGPLADVRVWIRDEGSGIAIDRLPQATLERGYSSAGTLGHGFWLALNCCDRVYLLTNSAGTTVVLEQGREATDAATDRWWLGRPSLVQ